MGDTSFVAGCTKEVRKLKCLRTNQRSTYPSMNWRVSKIELWLVRVSGLEPNSGIDLKKGVRLGKCEMTCMISLLNSKTVG